MQAIPSGDSPLPRSVYVLIIGGGPAGSCAAAWLGHRGVNCLLVEKERFPRFHIGESLLPHGNRILKEIGAYEKVANAGFITKYAAEFTTVDRSRSVRNVFRERLIPGLDFAFQVDRAKFDQILLDHAESCGCPVRQAHRVARAEATSSGWRVEIQNTETLEVHALDTAWVIDASGRGGTLPKPLGLSREPMLPGSVCHL